MPTGDTKQLTCPVCGGRLNWPEEPCPVCAARERSRAGPQRFRMPSRGVLAVGTIGLLCIAARFLIPDAPDAASPEAVRAFWAKSLLTLLGFMFVVAALLKHGRSGGWRT